MSNESPNLTTLGREALARMVGELEAQLTTARIRIAETDATLTETLNGCDRLRAENATLGAERADLLEAQADTRRLTRLLDEAISGEGNAAEQASLCDLVEPARRLREERNQLKAQVATLESVVRAKDREIGLLVASIDDRERIITRQGKTLAAIREALSISSTEREKQLEAQLAAARAETSQLQTRLKQTQGDLMLTRDALDVCLDDRTAARDKVERVTEQVKQLRAELAEVKTDDITDSWWVSFERMLSQEQLDAIGLSEDRGATVCIARLASAWIYAEQEAERQQTAFHQSLRAQVNARGEVERLRAELEQERSSHADTRHQWANTQLELGRQCAIRDEKNYEVNRLRATLVRVTAQVRIIQECATKATCGDLPCAVHEMTPREFEIFQATTSYVGALEFVSEAAATIAAIVAASAETTESAASSDPARPCCPECNEEKNLAYIQTNAEAEEWLCKTCRHPFQFKPSAEGQEAADGKG